MARNQKNYSFFAYEDDDTLAWNVRGEDGGAASGVDGHTASDPTSPVWIRSRHNQPRKIIYQDSTTGRTIDPIFYTQAAYAAVSKGDTLAVQVAGLATTVNYTAVRKVAEKKAAVPAFSRHLADS